GITVIEPEMKSREIYSGREIRRKIINGEPWEYLVPAEVSKVIMEIDGVKRMQDLSKTDEVNK
ncbi:MAG: nicotinamide-nucleotide adenylyltransferase, partial [Thermoplasmatales archaeon]